MAIALLAAIACSGDTETVVQTVLVPGEKVVETVIVEKEGETVIETVIVEKEGYRTGRVEVVGIPTATAKSVEVKLQKISE